MEEKEHLIWLLRETKKALETDNVIELQSLSDQTIHSASTEQHTDYILIAIIIYSIGKIAAKRDSLKIKNWPELVAKINKRLEDAVTSLEQNNIVAFGQALKGTRRILTDNLSLKPFIEDVLKKASINKASKIYEHGISLSQTAKLLGLSKWELAEYVGQKNLGKDEYSQTIDIKKRATIALEFFS